MKKIILTISIMASLFLFSRCDILDVEPVSSITDANYWKTADQFDAFIVGVHARFRMHAYSFFILGESRSDVFGDDPFGGEASQGLERLPYNTINADNPGLSNYAGFYENINQLNLFIAKTVNSNILTENKKNYYLGQAYGMRAFYYFHLVRSWGDVILMTEPTLSMNVSDLSKPVSPASDIMKQIKGDIDQSVKHFGTDYSFMGNKSYWSKAATLMLKGEVYLWTGRQTGGGAQDARAAKEALTDIQKNVPDLGLLPSFKDVFAYKNKGNKEIIFAVRYQLNEMSMWDGSFAGNFLPQNNYLITYYDEATGEKFNTTVENMLGLIRLGIQKTHYTRFNDKDSRKRYTLKGVFNKLSNGDLDIAGIYCYKYQGINDVGSSRSMNDDYPVYRYADLLLMIAEAKSMLGENPAEEINQVRMRAFGENYEPTTIGFPNQTIDKDVNNAILEERFFEFVMEGKRWYDLRRFGNEYVFKYTLADPSDPRKLLWPIDKGTLTNNRALKQTPGY